MLENTQNQQSKFRTKNWVKMNYDLRRMYSIDSQINFKASRYAYILAKGTITVPDASAIGAAAINTNKNEIIKNCTPFTPFNRIWH